MHRRVVITGIGPVTGFGVGIEPFWTGCVEGRSAIRRISRFDPSGFDCRFAAEMPDELLSIRDVVPKSYRKATKVMCRDIELAVAGADAALKDAGLITKGIDAEQQPTILPSRFGCHIGAGLIAADVDELTAALVTSRNGDGAGAALDLADWGRSGMNNLTPLWLLKYLPNMLACHVTIIHDLQGPSNTITCCEASSALSLGESVRVIARGSADACVSGGAEFKINPMALYRQHAGSRLAQTGDADDPATIVRPFDPAASGTILGEGGGVVVLEAMESAQSRGATVYAEVAGFASTQSLCRYSLDFAFDPEDTGIADAIEGAMHQAGVAPDEIDAIVPLGSSIRNVDDAEAAAITRVFGERAATIPLATTIPNVGNCNAGNGGVGLCLAAKMLVEQTLPARLNTQGAEGVDANACESRPADLQCVLVVSTSQGGQNAAVVLRRVR
jgi:3-oxoacyl-[acyl-carrier-protein] synthase II